MKREPEIMGAMCQIAHEIRTQNNAATAEPMVAVEQKRRIWGVDPDYHSAKLAWVDAEEGTEVDDDEAKRLEACYEQSLEVPEGYRRVWYTTIWEFVSVCVSRKAADSYIERQRHNLNEPRTYTYSGHDNPEWKLLRRFFLDCLPEENPTLPQIKIIEHSLGSSDHFRNHYAVDPDPELDDFQEIERLVEKGMMRRGREIPGGLVYYHVTDYGKQFAFTR